jgi:hypothetical protein
MGFIVGTPIFSEKRIEDIRCMLSLVASRPERGPETSLDARIGHGPLRAGDPVPEPGMTWRESGGMVYVRLTETTASYASYDELTMTPTSFEGFKLAMANLLGSPLPASPPRLAVAQAPDAHPAEEDHEPGYCEACGRLYDESGVFRMNIGEGFDPKG